MAPKNTTKKTTRQSQKPIKEVISESEFEEEEEEEDDDKLEKKIEKVMKKVMHSFKLSFKKEFKEDMREFEKSLNYNSTKLDEVLEEMRTIKDRQKNLEKENETLRYQLKTVSQVVEDLEQYTRNRNIQIDGITPDDDENLREMMITIGKKIEVDIEDKAIDAIHRIPSQNEKNSPIIVQFTTRQIREKIMTNIKNTKITTKDLGRKGEERTVFVNEHLTKNKKQLMFEARKLKKTNEYMFLWSKNGKIFIRKGERTPVIELKNFDDLGRIK